MNVNYLLLRVEMGWATSMCGPVAMAVRMMIATAMDTQPACGPFLSTAPSTTDKMRITTRVAHPPLPLLSAMGLRTQTREW